MSILNEPIILHKGRYKSIGFSLSEGGAAIPVAGIPFICDLKLKVGEDPIVTLSSETSPPSIVPRAGEGNEHKADIIFSEALLSSLEIPTNSQIDFPFVKMVGEVCYYEDGVKKILFKFPIRVYEEVTTSDVP